MLHFTIFSFRTVKHMLFVKENVVKWISRIRIFPIWTVKHICFEQTANQRTNPRANQPNKNNNTNNNNTISANNTIKLFWFARPFARSVVLSFVCLFVCVFGSRLIRSFARLFSPSSFVCKLVFFLGNGLGIPTGQISNFLWPKQKRKTQRNQHNTMKLCGGASDDAPPHVARFQSPPPNHWNHLHP